jgi:hypothetical protein
MCLILTLQRDLPQAYLKFHTLNFLTSKQQIPNDDISDSDKVNLGQNKQKS